MAQVPSAETVVIADGNTRQFSFEFFYLETADVFVTVDGVAVEFEWLASHTVLLAEAPEAGATVRMYRSTPAARPKYEFQLGAPFLPRYIDENFTQGLYVLQEGLGDISNTELRMDSVEDRMDSVEDRVANFEITSGYEFLGDYADGPWTVERYNQLIRDSNGEFWRVSGQVDLPYVTTGAGLPEGGSFVSVGDAVLRLDLASADPGRGASLVSTESGESVEDALGRRVIVVDSIVDLVNSDLHLLDNADDIVVYVRRYWKGFTSASGGGFFTLVQTSQPHDGGRRIGPTVPWDGQQSTHAAFLNGVGEVETGRAKRWLRVDRQSIAEESPTAYGAHGVANVVPDNTYILNKFESELPGVPADLRGFNLKVSKFPTGAKYYNGTFTRTSDNKTINAGYEGIIRSGNRNVIIGKDTVTNLPLNYNEEFGGGGGYNITAVGDGALGNAGTALRNAIAIGPRAMFNNEYGIYNVAIGLEAMYELTGNSGNRSIGSRNVAIGDNCARFNQGDNNVAIGRNAMQANSTGSRNVVIGSSAGAAIGPVWIDGSTIYNPFPRVADGQTLVGLEAGRYTLGDGTTAVGEQALFNLKAGSQNTAVGQRALRDLEIGFSERGSDQISSNSSSSGTFTQSGNTITINTNSPVEIYAGNIAVVTFESGVPSNVQGVTQYVTVLAGGASVSSFTVRALDSATRSGNCTLRRRYLNAVVNSSQNNVALGDNAGLQMRQGSDNTLLGQASGYNLDSGDENTAVGRSALRHMQNGSDATNLSNATGIGFGARVSGNNQVQLGDSRTTTYVFGAVQSRSDRRDKADITNLSDDYINFFMDVEWVTFRWDYREDYQEIDEDGNVTYLEKDGSKKRNRLHIGAIAQQVEEAAKKHGVDFAGLQHHSIAGGSDVYTIGYQEFIGIQGEIIRRQQKKLESIEERLAAAGI